MIFIRLMQKPPENRAAFPYFVFSVTPENTHSQPIQIYTLDPRSCTLLGAVKRLIATVDAKRIILTPQTSGSAGYGKRSRLRPMPTCMPCAIPSDRGRRIRRPLTLQYVAGHDNIKTTMRYTHPREAAVHKLFRRLADWPQAEEGIAPRGRRKILCSRNTLPERTH